MFALYVRGKLRPQHGVHYLTFISRPSKDKEATKPVFSSGGALQVNYFILFYSVCVCVCAAISRSSINTNN